MQRLAYFKAISHKGNKIMQNFMYQYLQSNLEKQFVWKFLKSEKWLIETESWECAHTYNTIWLISWCVYVYVYM